MNSREFRVIGLSRSGNHAIINWILKQSRGQTCFLNCAERTSTARSSAVGSSEVPAVANGSSFDGRRFHGRAAGMATRRRWLHFADDPVFHRLFDRVTHALAAQIFTDTGYPGTGAAAEDTVAAFDGQAILEAGMLPEM